ncbi:MAG: hemerythrin domain-containing protein [Burkholderiales bacterium]|jgi:hemerythrin-like metal-binding protein|nr:hemerythrin domain-containing protein [Gallionella sp.]
MEWKTEYATGIHNIDQQHRKILEFLTQFEGLSAGSADPVEVHRLIARTRAFMEIHFCTEEALMLLVPHTDSAVHRAEHRYVLENLADLEDQSRLEVGKDELLPLMRHLLFDHVLGSDRYFARRALANWGEFTPR